MGDGLALIRAAMVADGETVRAAPGAVLLEGERIVAAGAPEALGTPADAVVREHRDAVIVPALVNAHAHLDLSHRAPAPYGGDFIAWIDEIRRARATTDEAIASAVRRGVALARAGGTALVGDVAGAGSIVPLEVLREEGLAGVGFVEVFGIAEREGEAIERLRRTVREVPAEASGVRLGLQPHAPYSCGLEVYRVAAGLGRPLSTHLAETPEELQFVAEGRGPLADFLIRLGIGRGIGRGVGRDVGPGSEGDRGFPATGAHPVDALAEVLAAAPILVAHLNYLEPGHVERLAAWPVTVAYCPRSSRYFGHPKDGAPSHRYREMMEAGITVALGTDGLPCLDTPDRISVLDEMRLLHVRDGTEPRTLLRMATTNGARGLGFDPAPYTLAPGAVAGLLALAVPPSAAAADPLAAALRAGSEPRWVLGAGRPQGAQAASGGGT